MGDNPDHKRRVDGSTLGNKDTQRGAKVYKASGRVEKPKKMIKGCESDLALRRIFRMLEEDDD